MHTTGPAYGLWGLVALNSVVFIVFAFSFAKPASSRDWRSFGAFAAFIVALFAEMYGFPLTLYLLAGWLQSRFPAVDWSAHNSGHLWQTLLGSTGNPHVTWIHILSNLILLAGFLMLANSWPVLYRAQRAGALATEGLYRRLRHPQYVGFILIMAGFLLQWPTLLTLVMFPVLVTMYVRLALHEELDAARTFGAAWDAYALRTPRFIPRIASDPRAARPAGG